MKEYYKKISYQRWTLGSIECYKRGCICTNCPTFNILGNKCRMKVSVLNLVRKFGAPKKGGEDNQNR